MDDKDNKSGGSLGDIFGDDFFDNLKSQTEKSNSEPEEEKKQQAKNEEKPKIVPQQPVVKPVLTEEEEMKRKIDDLKNSHQNVSSQIAKKQTNLATKKQDLESLEGITVRDNAESFNIAKKRKKIRDQIKKLEEEIERDETVLEGINGRISELENKNTPVPVKEPPKPQPTIQTPQEPPVLNPSVSEPVLDSKKPEDNSAEKERFQKEYDEIDKRIKELEMVEKNIEKDLKKNNSPAIKSKIEGGLFKLRKDLESKRNALSLIKGKIKSLDSGGAKTDDKSNKTLSNREVIRNREKQLDDEIYGNGLFENLNQMVKDISRAISNNNLFELERLQNEANGAVEFFKDAVELLKERAADYSDISKEVKRREEAAKHFIQQWQANALRIESKISDIKSKQEKKEQRQREEAERRAAKEKEDLLAAERKIKEEDERRANEQARDIKEREARKENDLKNQEEEDRRKKIKEERKASEEILIKARKERKLLNKERDPSTLSGYIESFQNAITALNKVINGFKEALEHKEQILGDLKARGVDTRELEKAINGMRDAIKSKERDISSFVNNIERAKQKIENVGKPKDIVTEEDKKESKEKIKKKSKRELDEEREFVLDFIEEIKSNINLNDIEVLSKFLEKHLKDSPKANEIVIERLADSRRNLGLLEEELEYFSSKSSPSESEISRIKDLKKNIGVLKKDIAKAEADIDRIKNIPNILRFKIEKLKKAAEKKEESKVAEDSEKKPDVSAKKEEVSKDPKLEPMGAMARDHFRGLGHEAKMFVAENMKQSMWNNTIDKARFAYSGKLYKWHEWLASKINNKRKSIDDQVKALEGEKSKGTKDIMKSLNSNNIDAIQAKESTYSLKDNLIDIKIQKLNNKKHWLDAKLQRREQKRDSFVTNLKVLAQKVSERIGWHIMPFKSRVEKLDDPKKFIASENKEQDGQIKKWEKTLADLKKKLSDPKFRAIRSMIKQEIDGAEASLARAKRSMTVSPSQMEYMDGKIKKFKNRVDYWEKMEKEFKGKVPKSNEYLKLNKAA